MRTDIPTTSGNGFGVTALVLGIVGIVFAFIPIIGVIAWPLVVLGLVFGILGIRRARVGNAGNLGAAVTGTVLSAVGLVVCFLWVAVLGSTLSPGAPQPALTAHPNAPTEVAFGQPLAWPGGEQITISAPQAYDDPNPYLDTPGRSASLDVTVVNGSDTPYNVMETTITAQHDARVAQQNFLAGNPLPNVELAPGDSTGFTVVYDVGNETGPLTLSVKPNYFAAETRYVTGEF